MIRFNWHPYSDLSPEQIYEILTVRSEVFVVEQRCPYLDPDGKDSDAIHFLGTKNDSIVAYLRLFLPTENQKDISFGRVLTVASARNKGYGRKLIEEMMSFCQVNYSGVRIHCSAQLYLQKFYEEFGFQSYGEIYDEDWIPHIAMEKII